MPWPQPPLASWITRLPVELRWLGDVIATNWREIFSYIFFWHSKFPYALLYKTSGQSIPNDTLTTVQWEAVSNMDPEVLWVAASNTRLTIPSAHAGTWLLTAQCDFGPAAGNYREIIILKNGSEVAGVRLAPTSAGHWNGQVSWLGKAAVADYFQVQVAQDSGGPLNLEAASIADSWFAAQRIS